MNYKYIEIAKAIKEKINDGTYLPGDLLPDQTQIAKEFNTTRSTVHKALKDLVIEGMIYSKRGAGTFVRKDYSLLKDHHQSVTDFDDPFSDRLSNSLESKILQFSVRMPSEAERNHLLVEPEVSIYEVRRVRFLEGEIFSYEHFLMPTTIIKLTDEILKKSVYQSLREQNFHIEGTHRIINAKKASEKDLKNGIVQNATDPVLVIRQLNYLDDGQPFQLLETRYPFAKSDLISDITV
ncbi:GntR family transcriptional regulator [Companilactobacillus suantsaicola]|uniref:GntR family transcriptional regulator n=1 Tax=Companilactobacillus suantsaicola TaxID=2487723 RepID=A0A4Z0JK30_9LACO|nr:GntR family transcriptional regulator [Companilactobacillus suantsaicola]TGD22653.1 GntR family transcriptional regulator [Companilactobacillus suantsaicola]